MSDTQETMTTEAAAPEATPEKPKRGRSRKKAEEAPAPASAAEGAEAPAAPAKKTTRRRAAAKPADEAASPAATEAPTAEEAPKPRRTRARKTPEPAAEEGTAAATDAAPATSETSEEAPKPRRARTRKAASEPAADAEEKASQAKEPEGAEASAAGAGKSEAPAPADAPESKEAPRRERTTTTVIRRRDREERRQNQSGQGQSGQGQGKNGQNKQNAQNSQGGKKNKKNRHENRNREPQPSVSKEELTELKVADLRARAAEAGVDAAGLKKAELVDAIYEAVCKAEGFTEVTGVLDIMGDGYGFLRTSGYLPGENGHATWDSPPSARNGLRKGDMCHGHDAPGAREREVRGPAEGVGRQRHGPSRMHGLTGRRFGDLTPVFPDERLLMEHGKNTTTARVIDLTAPIGKGQRGLIVSARPRPARPPCSRTSPPPSRRTTRTCTSCAWASTSVPRKATDMERSIRGEVVSSTFDMPSENHIQVAELVIERAKRLVEQGKDVVILLDSITRLARAYNLAQPASGPHPVRRRGLHGALSAQALPGRRPQHRGRRLAHHPRLGPHRDRVEDGRGDLRGVQGHRQHGAASSTATWPTAASSRPSTPSPRARARRSCCMDPQEAPLIWGVRRILANTNCTERAMDMLIKSLKQTEIPTRSSCCAWRRRCKLSRVVRTMAWNCKPGESGPTKEAS